MTQLTNDLSTPSAREKYHDSPWEIGGGVVLGIIGVIAGLMSGMDMVAAIFAGLVGLMFGAIGGKYLQKQFDTPSITSPDAPDALPGTTPGMTPSRDPASLQAALDKGFTPSRHDSPTARHTPIDRTQPVSRHLT